MSTILIIVGVVVIVYFLIKGNKKPVSDSSSGQLEVDDNDYEKHSILLKEATRLKKEGDLDGAIMKIDKALSFHKDNSSVYKKAFYLQLNKQFDEAWKIMSKYNEDTNIALLESTNWGSFLNVFSEYADSNSSLIKLLKKEKKMKDVIYYLPASEYCFLLRDLSNLSEDVLNLPGLLKTHINGSLSSRAKIKSKEFNLELFDSKYGKFISENKDKLTDLWNIAQKTRLDYYYSDSEDDEPIADVIRDAKDKMYKHQKEALPLLKSLIHLSIKINDTCYDAATSDG